MLEDGNIPGQEGGARPSTGGPPSQGTIALWWIDLDSADASVATLLPDERARADRLRLPHVRQRFLAGRVALRRILADELGCAPVAVGLRTGPHGKPMLAGGEFAFNLSHSGGLAVLAVGGDRQVGVDCEVMSGHGAAIRRTIDPFLSPDERAMLDAAARPDAARLYRLWTRKEAVAKATGLGFRFAFKATAVLSEDEDRIVTVPEYGAFRLHGLDARPSVAATLCVAGSAALPSIVHRHHPA